MHIHWHFPVHINTVWQSLLINFVSFPYEIILNDRSAVQLDATILALEDVKNNDWQLNTSNERK